MAELPRGLQRFADATKCARCGAPVRGVGSRPHMSMFNFDCVCDLCQEDELGAPNYAAARAADVEATRYGNYAFEGIGLTLEDEVYLTLMRSRRAE